MTDRWQPERIELAGTSWLVREIAGQPALEAAPPTIAFGHDGRAAGSTGANRFTGGYVLVGDELSFGPLATTRRSGPPAVMDQQQRFLASLLRPSHVALDADELVLRHEGSESRLAPAPPAEDRGRGAPALVVRGTVTYRERVPLPARAAVVVRLLASTDHEPSPLLLAERVITAPRSLPVRFELSVPAADVEPEDRISVWAAITSGDQLLWRSDAPLPALTGGAPDIVHVVLRRVG